MNNNLIAVALLGLLSVFTPFFETAHATVTTVGYWRMGEADPGAASGGVCPNTTNSVGGGVSLKMVGTPVYTNDVAAGAALHANSALSLRFQGGSNGTNAVVSTTQNNFGVELWVKCDNNTDANRMLAYNGNASTSGWGVFQNGANFSCLYGGVVVFGSSAITPGAWTHLALVRNNGTATFYINGAATGGSSTATPNVPAGQFQCGVGGFNGCVDEVRVFTFTAGAFSTNDLLLNFVAPPSATTLAATSVAATNVTLNGTVNPNGATTSAYFQYGLDTSYGSFSITNTLSAASSVTNLLSGLSPGTTYHYRLVATNSAGTTLGGDAIFTLLNGSFANGGFENGTNGVAPTGWTVNTYINQGITLQTPQTFAGLNLAPGGTNITVTLATNGPFVGTHPALGAGASFRWPRYGTKCANVNQGGLNKNVNAMSQTVTVGAADVDPSDGLVHVRFTLAPILQSPIHTVNANPYCFIQVQNLSQNFTLYSDFQTVGADSIPWNKVNAGLTTEIDYTDWQMVDVAPGNNQLAIGDTVKLQIFAAGCSLSAHWGEVYVDGVGPIVPGISVEGSAPVVSYGSTLTYTFDYRNGAPISESAAVFRFNLPANTTFQSINCPGLVATTPAVGASGTVSVNWPNPLSAGASGSFDVTVGVNSGALGSTLLVRDYQISSLQETALLGPPIKTLVLPVAAPALVTQPATGITATTATLNGTVNPNGAATAAYFQFGLDTNYGSFSATNTLAANNAVLSVTNLLSGLSPGTTYHYRLVATNSAGTSAGLDAVFSTLPVVTVTAVGGTGIGSGSYYPGSNVVISATGSNAHWSFTGWNDGNSSLTRTIVIPLTNITYTANFTQSFTALTAYVALASTNPVRPYATWATAATNIQTAIDVLLAGDTVLVSNGVYATGGRVASGTLLTNRVVIDKAITVQSVNGPAVTIIQGLGFGNLLRCVWMTPGSSLTGFSLINGFAGQTFAQLGNGGDGVGGGVYADSLGGTATLSNCVLSGNYAARGGGSYGATLNHCTLSSNQTPDFIFRGFGNPPMDTDGGGAVGGTLNNCLLQGNTAGYGGGAEGATLNNCLLIANNAYFRGSDAIGTLNNCTVVGGGFGGTAGGGSSGLENSKLTNCILKVIVSYTSCTFSYCCVSPLPPGPGNIASDPQFVDAANGNYHLSATSPCLNAGTNAFAPGTTDLDGNPRILNSVVDMGAYETLLPPVSFSLAGNRQLIGGAFQLSFSNVSGLGFTVFGSTNVALPSNLWSNLGPAVETPPASGNYQFTDPQATNKATRFYRVRSP